MKYITCFEKLISQYSLIGNETFYDNKYFPWIPKLESNWMLIRKELDIIMEHIYELPNYQDIVPGQDRIANDNLWKVFGFYAYGIKVKKNCARCPCTTRLIEKIPGMKTAFFSILLPQKHIPKHRGPYKGVIRYQLGLIVPKSHNSCGIRVANDVRFWKEGKSLIFDDTFEHEAWNNSQEIRVVLFLDIIRPMPFPLSLINSLIVKYISLSPFIQNSINNQKTWDSHLDQIFSVSENYGLSKSPSRPIKRTRKY